MTRPAALLDSSFTPGSAKPDPVLTATRVVRRFGGLTAVDVDHVEFQRGALTSIIGPNGAGKSSFLNVLTGFDRADAGTWAIDGLRMDGLAASAVARHGMVRTFQHTRPLPELTVLENMQLAASSARDERLLAAPLRWLWKRRSNDERERAVRVLADFGMTEEQLTKPAGTLSGGQRKLLEIARAVIADPAIILLDEPMAGVNPALRDFIGDKLLELRSAGLTVVMVEHDMTAVMRLSDWVVCMGEGRVIAEGSAAHVSAHPDVIEAYLGAHNNAGGVHGKADAVQRRPPADTRSIPAADVAPVSQPSAPLLEVSDIIAGYTSGIDILNGCSIRVASGEIVSIIGPNGAGKSTLLKAVFGLVRNRQGTITFAGSDITRRSAGDLVRRGIGYVPQSDNVFGSLTVRENLRMGIYGRPQHWRERSEAVLDLFPVLAERSGQLGGSLSGGERQLLAMARALMMEPELLLLDEPSAGLSPIRMDELFQWITDIAATGITVLLVEQNAKRALDISDRGYVLVQGRNAHEGTGAQLLDDPVVTELYLGASAGKSNTGAAKSTN